MVHLTEIYGSDLEAWWYTCSCGQEECLWNEESEAKLEAELHLAIETQEF